MGGREGYCWNSAARSLRVNFNLVKPPIIKEIVASALDQADSSVGDPGFTPTLIVAELFLQAVRLCCST